MQLPASMTGSRLPLDFNEAKGPWQFLARDNMNQCLHTWLIWQWRI
jgi:hypothetical protein